MKTRFEKVEPDVATRTAALRRLTALGVHWRASVEAWPVRGGWWGRLVFEPEPPVARFEARKGAPTLYGQTLAEVLDEAHGFSEQRLRALLHSLG